MLKQLMCVAVCLLSLAPTLGQSVEELSEELLILYVDENHEESVKRTRKLIKGGKGKEKTLGYMHSFLAHYRLALTESHGNTYHLDSAVSHAAMYSKMAYGNLFELFRHKRNELSYQLYATIQEFDLSTHRDTLSYQRILSHCEQMVPFSSDSLYDYSNYLCLKVMNNDTSLLDKEFQLMVKILRDFEPIVYPEQDERTKVKYPRYRIDPVLQLAFELKERYKASEGLTILSILQPYYGEDEDFKILYKELMDL